MQDLERRHKSVVLDFCQFGEPWLKPTKLVYSRLLDLQSIGKRCGFRCNAWRCTRSGHFHIPLVGRDARGVWMTHRAQPYPHSLVRALAKLFDDQLR